MRWRSVLSKASTRFEETEADIKFKEGLFKLSKSQDGVSLEMAIKHITLDQNIRDAIDHNDPEFKQLVESIKEVGLLQLPVVTVDLDQGKILCLGGHRRIEALRTLGKESVKVVYRNLEDRPVQKLAQLMENVARQNLQPLELASAINDIKKAEKYTATRLAELLGKERKYIERLVKIDNWPAEAKAFVRANAGKFTLKNLFAIAARKIDDSEVLVALQKIASPERKGAEAKPTKATKLTSDSVGEYIKSKQLSKREQEAILNFVREMNLLVITNEDMGHGVPTENTI
jgi:ParB/RepB/Spo0J family partition protein